ncbi:MAG: carboxypeptidase-like regulatory domain-containing protein [Bacillota bacterium]
MRRLLVSAIIAVMLFIPVTSYAHGAKIEYTNKMSYEITARFDSGEPMADAQIIVYSPQDPAVPWITGTADEKGQYIFTPDLREKGIWTIQVRKAGHGAQINIEVGDTASVKANTGYSLVQKLVMTASVVWGLIGTALFFGRRKN